MPKSLSVEVWHVGELPKDSGKTLRDENGLAVAVFTSAEDCRRVALLSELQGRCADLCMVATWDDEFTEKAEFHEAYDPCEETLKALDPHWANRRSDPHAFPPKEA